jgi:hypothetical protein
MNQEYDGLKKRLDLLTQIVVLQSSMICELQSAMDEHDLDGPHYTDRQKLERLTQEYLAVATAGETIHG